MRCPSITKSKPAHLTRRCAWAAACIRDVPAEVAAGCQARQLAASAVIVLDQLTCTSCGSFHALQVEGEPLPEVEEKDGAEPAQYPAGSRRQPGQSAVAQQASR